MYRVAWTVAAASCIVGCGRRAFERPDDAAAVDVAVDVDTTTYASAVLEDAPTAYWRLDETSGPHIDELGVHHSVSTRVSARGVVAPTAQAGVGVVLDGVDDEITIADHADFEVGASSFTVELVAEIGVIGSSYNRFISHEVYGQDGWYVSMHATPSWGIAVSRWSQGTERAAASGTYAPVGALVHIVAVYDADALALLLYIDGAMRSSATGVTGLVGDVSQEVVMGRPSNSSAQYYAGRLYEVAFYKGKALSLDRVSAHHAALGI